MKLKIIFRFRLHHSNLSIHFWMQSRERKRRKTFPYRFLFFLHFPHHHSIHHQKRNAFDFPIGICSLVFQTDLKQPSNRYIEIDRFPRSKFLNVWFECDRKSAIVYYILYYHHHHRLHRFRWDKNIANGERWTIR